VTLQFPAKSNGAAGASDWNSQEHVAETQDSDSAATEIPWRTSGTKQPAGTAKYGAATFIFRWRSGLRNCSKGRDSLEKIRVHFGKVSAGQCGSVLNLRQLQQQPRRRHAVRLARKSWRAQFEA